MQTAKTSMTELAVLTPSYGPDAALCAELNRSILLNTDDKVIHHIVVPKRDRRHFRALEGARTIIHDVEDFLPPHILKLPLMNAWINLRRPFPPIRGWICQQIVKLSAAVSINAEGILIMDSDMVLIRRISPRTFVIDGEPVLYRKDRGIHSGLPRHRTWDATCRALLGVQPPPPGNLADYVCWPCYWSPKIVKSLLASVEASTGFHWTTAIGGSLHFSEMMLYGIYVDEVMGGAKYTTSDMGAIVYSEERALTPNELIEFLDDVGAQDIAVMISAKANINIEMRRMAIDELLKAHASEE